MAESSSKTVATPPPIIHGIQPPTGLNLTDKHKATNWKAYKQQWENYAIVSQLEKQTEEYRVALFLYSIGTEAVKIYNSFDMTEENRRKLSEIMKEFDRYAVGETNETYERYVFNSRNQKEDENIDKYVAELRTLAQSCGFCKCLTDSLIRDRIVLGIRNDETRKRLLRQPKLTLQKCIDIVKSEEISMAQLKSMGQATSAEDVHRVYSGYSKFKKPNRKNKGKKPETDRKQSSDKLCDYCGNKHKTGKEHCKAWGQICGACGKMNHFAKLCRQRGKAHAVEEVSDSESSTDSLYMVTDKAEISEAVNSVTDRAIYANMIIDKKVVKFHIDCGATVNVLPSKYVNACDIKPTKRILQMWNKTEFKPKGTCRVKIRNPKNNRKYSIEFMIVNDELTPLLGAKVSQQMGLIKVQEENFEKVSATHDKNEETTGSDKGLLNTGSTEKAGSEEALNAEEIIEKYKDVFEGELGTLEGKQHLTVDPTVPPHIAPARRVSFALRPKLKAELERLTDLGVLKPVDEPTDWVSNLVVATKESGDLRLCLDPKPLNSALKRERYPLPVIDDVLPDLSKAKVFTKVDARNGYWHVQLDEESSKLTTFDTPNGRYRWMRLPFGISVASEIFQKRLNQALDRLDGVLTVHDDMVIYGVGETEEEATVDHNKKLRHFLQRCKEKGVKLNKRKLKLKCKQITYLGHLITEDGLKPDPEKIEAVQKMPKPTDVKGVRRFCGFVNYLAKFLPRLAEVMGPIQQLTRRDVEWQWQPEHDAAFEHVKKMITRAPLLKYYDPKEELTVQCDASDKGLGAALMQKGQPIAYASRALTETETRYAQIEKEMLAVVYALQKFDQYVSGRHVTVQSDHKPLQAIAKKPLRNAPKRLQGMLLKVQKYDVTIIYRPGPEMHLADTLSRAYLSSSTNTQGEFERVNAVKLLPMTDERLEDLMRATQGDEVIQKLKEVIQAGWPDEKKDMEAVLAPYFNFRDEMSVYNGLVFRGALR